jgi:hypothetical protein
MLRARLSHYPQNGGLARRGPFTVSEANLADFDSINKLKNDKPEPP